MQFSCRILSPALLGFFLVGCASGPSSAPIKAPPPVPLTGTPTWLPVGRDVLTPDDRLGAQAKTQNVLPEPRWFQASGQPPATFEALPLEYEGVGLALTPAVLDTGDRVVVNVTLSSKSKTVYRFLQDRRINVWPVLLAVYVDGQAVRIPLTEAPPSPLRPFTERAPLASKGDPRPLLVRIRGASLRALLPDDQKHELTLIAAFAEPPHVPLREVVTSGQLLGHPLRSQALRLLWTGKEWQFIQSD